MSTVCVVLAASLIIATYYLSEDNSICTQYIHYINEQERHEREYYKVPKLLQHLGLRLHSVYYVYITF